MDKNIIIENPVQQTVQIKNDVGITNENTPVQMQSTIDQNVVAEEPGEEVTQEPDDEKQKNIMKVIRYSQTFPSIFEKFKIDINGLEKLPVDKVENLLKTIRVSISCERSQRQLLKMSAVGFNIVEGITKTITPLKVEGLANYLILDEEVQDTMKEISIEYGDMTYVNPITRLGFSIVLAMSQLDRAARESENYKKNPIKIDMKSKVNEKTVEEFKNL